MKKLLLLGLVTMMMLAAGCASIDINVGEDDAANVAITELDLQTGRLVAGTTGGAGRGLSGTGPRHPMCGSR